MTDCNNCPGGGTVKNAVVVKSFSRPAEFAIIGKESKAVQNHCEQNG
jgi:hypothetical protein